MPSTPETVELQWHNKQREYAWLNIQWVGILLAIGGIAAVLMYREFWFLYVMQLTLPSMPSWQTATTAAAETRPAARTATTRPAETAATRTAPATRTPKTTAAVTTTAATTTKRNTN